MGKKCYDNGEKMCEVKCIRGSFLVQNGVVWVEVMGTYDHIGDAHRS